MTAPSAGRAIRAVLFDLDGTLVDSERATDESIAVVMAGHGVPDARLPPEETRGRTWRDIATALIVRHSVQVPVDALAEAMLEAWLPRVADAPPIPGARDAVSRAAERFSVAVVSSSPRSVIDLFLERLGVSSSVLAPARIGAEDVRAPKPAPEGFLLAAKRLGVPPDACLVFEDSVAGLEAARAAGMVSMAVLHAAAEPERVSALASGAVTRYEALPAGFWAALEIEGARALGVWR